MGILERLDQSLIASGLSVDPIIEGFFRVLAEAEKEDEVQAKAKEALRAWNNPLSPENTKLLKSLHALYREIAEDPDFFKEERLEHANKIFTLAFDKAPSEAMKIARGFFKDASDHNQGVDREPDQFISALYQGTKRTLEDAKEHLEPEDMPAFNKFFEDTKESYDSEGEESEPTEKDLAKAREEAIENEEGPPDEASPGAETEDDLSKLAQTWRGAKEEEPKPDNGDAPHGGPSSDPLPPPRKAEKESYAATRDRTKRALGQEEEENDSKFETQQLSPEDLPGKETPASDALPQEDEDDLSAAKAKTIKILRKSGDTALVAVLGKARHPGHERVRPYNITRYVTVTSADLDPVGEFTPGNIWNFLNNKATTYNARRDNLAKRIKAGGEDAGKLKAVYQKVVKDHNMYYAAKMSKGMKTYESQVNTHEPIGFVGHLKQVVGATPKEKLLNAYSRSRTKKKEILQVLSSLNDDGVVRLKRLHDKAPIAGKRKLRKAKKNANILAFLDQQEKRWAPTNDLYNEARTMTPFRDKWKLRWKNMRGGEQKETVNYAKDAIEYDEMIRQMVDSPDGLSKLKANLDYLGVEYTEKPLRDPREAPRMRGLGQRLPTPEEPDKELWDTIIPNERVEDSDGEDTGVWGDSDGEDTGVWGAHARGEPESQEDDSEEPKSWEVRLGDKLDAHERREADRREAVRDWINAGSGSLTPDSQSNIVFSTEENPVADEPQKSDTQSNIVFSTEENPVADEPQKSDTPKSDAPTRADLKDPFTSGAYAKSKLRNLRKRASEIRKGKSETRKGKTKGESYARAMLNNPILEEVRIKANDLAHLTLSTYVKRCNDLNRSEITSMYDSKHQRFFTESLEKTLQICQTYDNLLKEHNLGELISADEGIFGTLVSLVYQTSSPLAESNKLEEFYYNPRLMIESYHQNHIGSKRQGFLQPLSKIV